MSKRTLFLIFALFVITFVLAIIAFYNPNNLNPKPQTSTVTPSKKPVAQTVLSFGDLTATSSSTKSALTTYSVPVNIATRTNKVTAVQLELQYDPLLLKNISVTPGSFFKNPNILLNKIDAKTGRISYALGIGLEEGQGVSETGTAAIIGFQTAKTAEKSAIIFLPKTLVTAENMTGSSLKQAKNGLFILAETE